MLLEFINAINIEINAYWICLRFIRYRFTRHRFVRCRLRFVRYRYIFLPKNIVWSPGRLQGMP